MFKKKKHILLRKRKSLYSTDHLMYGMFSLLVIIIIVFAILLLKAFSSSVSATLSSDIIGLFSGVLSGLLASVIVAWLLDFASCKRKNKILKIAVDEDLKNLKMWLNELFQEMRDSLSSQDNKGGLKFETLYKLFVERYITCKKPELLGKNLNGVYVNINMTIATIDKLTTGDEKEYLQILFDDVDPFLILNKSMYDLRENLFNNGNLSYAFIYSEINDFLSTVLLYVDLRSKEYNVTKVDQKEA